MPTIAIVDGVKIQMFYSDHLPAHFHAILGSDEVLVAIHGCDGIRGSLPPGKLQRVLAWARDHQDKLALNWNQVPGWAAAGEDLAMPQVLDNVIVAQYPMLTTTA
jgi:hypothetical protein